MTNPIIKGICFYCKTKQLLEQKPMFKDGKLCQEYYICPNCNAANSPLRLTKELKDKLIK